MVKIGIKITVHWLLADSMRPRRLSTFASEAVSLVVLIALVERKAGAGLSVRVRCKFDHGVEGRAIGFVAGGLHRDSDAVL